MIAEFAQIVGLLSAFSSGKKSDEVLSIVEFTEWLTKHNHEEIRKIVEQNQSTSISIKALLNSGVESINHKLDGISEQIAIIASHTEGVEELAASFAKESLSEQAIEILSLMDENETEFFLLSRSLGVKEQTLVLAPGLNYTCKESRFLKDDLELMTDLGLLVQDYNSSGDPMFYLTRAGSKLVAR